VGQRMVLPDLSMLGKLVEQVVQLAHRCMIELAVLEFRLIRCTVG